MNVVCFTYDTDPYAPWFNCSSHSTSHDLNLHSLWKTWCPMTDPWDEKCICTLHRKPIKNINHSWIGKYTYRTRPMGIRLWGYQVLWISLSLPLIWYIGMPKARFKRPERGGMFVRNTEDSWRISWKGMVTSIPFQVDGCVDGDFCWAILIFIWLLLVLCLLLVGCKDFFQWKGNVSKIPYWGRTEQQLLLLAAKMIWPFSFVWCTILLPFVCKGDVDPSVIDCRIWCWHGFQVEWAFKWLMSYPPWN